MNIAIIGGGNVGMLMAVEFAAKNHTVSVLTSSAASWCKNIQAYDVDNRLVYEGELALVTDDLTQAIQGADIVFVTYPTFMLETLARELLPILRPSQWLGVVPGNDAEFIFGEHVERGGVIFGLQRVHSVARLKEKGRSVYMLGRRTSGLHVAALPSKETSRVAQTMRELFDLPVAELPTYLAETLTPSNPILHTCRIYRMFRDWKPGVTYERNFLFYEEWDDETSKIIIACDAELQRVCRALEGELLCDLSGVKSLLEHYESVDAASMTAKIRSIPGFKGLTSPMKELSSGEWVPDFSSRYFKADFSYGLKAIIDIARLACVKTPHMDEVYRWYVETSGDTACFEAVPESLDDLIRLYV